MRWEETKLGECINFSNGYAFKSKHFSSDSNDVPLIKGENLGKGMIQWEKSKYWNRHDAERYSRFYLEPNDIVLAMDRTWVSGGIKYAIIKEDDPLSLQVQRIGRLRALEDKITPDFLRYVIASPNFAEYVRNIQGGVGVPHISPDQIKRYTFHKPALPTQRRIASILSAYDDLIENNLKRIKLLEEAAQNIYREWFVEMRFPNHEQSEWYVDEEGRRLPVGWKYVPFGEIVSYDIGGGWGKEDEEGDFVHPAFVIRGTDMPKMMSGNFSDVPFRYHKQSNLASRKLQPDDIIFEVSGGSKTQPVGRSLIVTDAMLESFEKDVMCASFCKLIRINKDLVSDKFVSLYLREIYGNGILAQYENQSASNIINFKFKDFLLKENLAIPSTEIADYFDAVINPIIELQWNLILQLQELGEARDILLPRLMNQTIEV